MTKNRRKVLTAEHIKPIRKTAAPVCDSFQASLIELDSEDDHVHLLIEYPPTVQISVLVNNLKGVSSRYLRKKFPGIKTHRNHLRSPPHFATSCGGTPIAVTRQHIEQQQTPDSGRHPGPEGPGLRSPEIGQQLPE